MKQTIKRICTLLLALCLLLSALPFTVNAEEEERIDFVLVLDCSGSMAKNDRNGLAADACKKFMDLLPIENARIAVIAYGYNGKGYDYTKFTVKYDTNLVQVLSELQGNMTTEEMKALKNSVAAAAKKESGSKPTSVIGQALAAGVDMLLTNGATDNNACIILLSDGDSTSPIAVGESDSLANSIPKTAKEHGWPIFCIELDYKGKNETSAGRENRNRLTNICVNSGAGADGRMKVSDPAEVTEALLKIFDRFMDISGGVNEMVTANKEGVANLEFAVPELASETTVIVSGSNLKYLELTNPKGVTREITESGKDGDWIANVEDGSYISVKILIPEAGTWTVKAYGDPNARLHVYDGSPRELNLELIGSPASGSNVTKNDKITLQSYFTYGNGTLNNSDFYAENAAEAVVACYSDDNTVKSRKTFPMTGDSSGYHLDLDVSQIPSGRIEVQVLLEHDMFRSGQKTSNSLTYTSENLPLGHDETQAIDRVGNVNAQLETIDLTKVFPNPDGDPIEYVIECVSDRNVKFEYTIDDSDYLVINTGLWAGEHQMQVSAKDEDMETPHVHPFTITVNNTPVEIDKIPRQEVWCDAYPFQDAGNMELNLDLNDYCTDPEGVPLTYGELSADAQNLVSATLNGSVLHVDPLAEGEVILTTTVSDGVETVNVEIAVKVVDGKTIFWRDNWIWFALAIAIVVLLILVYLYVKGHTTMKGSWKVTIKRGYDSITTGAGLKMSTLAVVKRAKSKPFSLKELVNETMKWMQDQNGLRTNAVSFLGMDDFEAIKLKGIYSGLGFMVMNVPNSANVEVEYNGQIKTKGGKFRVNTGELRVTIKRRNELGVEDKLTILLENTGK